MTRARGAIWSSALLLASSPALGQNLRDVPLGGRTATMGGAGVAAGTDAAMPYLNPGGIAGVPYDLFSLSASVYAYSRAGAQRVFRAGGIDPALGTDLVVEEERFDIDQFVIIPASAGFFLRFEEPRSKLVHVASLALLTITYNDYSVSGSFRARTSLARLEEDFISTESFQQVIGGPSYALQVSDRLRVGASLFASYTTLEFDAHDLALVSFDLAGAQLPNTFNTRATLDAYSVGVAAIVGAQARVHSDLWLGAAYELWGVPVVGGGDFLQTTDASFFDATNNQIATRVNTRGTFDRFEISRPSRISAGIAWDTPGVVAAAFDFHLSPGREEFLYGELDATVTQLTTGQPLAQQRTVAEIAYDTRDTWNLSAGAEYYVLPDVALRAGVLTDRDVGAGQQNGSEPDARLDWTVFTLGVGVRDGTLESSYGVAYRYGSGERPALDTFAPGDSPTQVNYTAHGIMLMLAGAIRTSEGERRRALEDIEREKREKSRR